MRAPRALVGCETSGIVRNALLARGIDAWSIDIQPSEDRSNRHIVDDIRNHLTDYWDFLAVLHPPCTRLCNSGVRWLAQPPPGRTREDIWRELDEGAALFSACWNAPIARKAIENPVMHRHAIKATGRGKTQFVQPWWFGDPAFKATGLELIGLPPLVPTNKLVPPAPGTADHKAWSAIHRCPPGPDRAKIRSQTFPGLAAAIADQFGAAAVAHLEQTAA